jgi:hypothetical protein
MTTATDTRPPYEARYYTSDGLPFEEALDRGLAWLFRTEHKQGAIVSHHGDSLKVRDNRRLTFVPQGSVDNRAPVVVLDVAAPRRRKTTHDRPLGQWGLAPQEIDVLVELLADRGYPVTSRWNGFPASSGSVALGEARLHPTMLAAIEGYHAGCAMHYGSVFCNCPHWREGFSRLTGLRARNEVTTL